MITCIVEIVTEELSHYELLIPDIFGCAIVFTVIRLGVAEFGLFSSACAGQSAPKSILPPWTDHRGPTARLPDPSKTQWAKTLFPQWSGCVDYPPSVDFWAFWEPWGLSRLPPCALQPPRASFSRSTNFMYSPIDINTTLGGKDSIVFHCLASSPPLYFNP